MTDEIDLGSNLLDNVPMPDKVKGVRGKNKVSDGSDKTVRIILDENEHIPPTGLFVGLNGRGYIIKPGEEVDVPEGVYNILNDAVMATPIQDPQTGQVLGSREKRRFPFSVVRRAA